MRKAWLFVLGALLLMAGCNNNQSTFSDQSAIATAKAHLAQVSSVLSAHGAELQWENIRIKQDDKKRSSYAILVPIEGSGNVYLHVSVVGGQVRGTLLLGYDATRTEAEVYNLDTFTSAIVTGLSTAAPRLEHTSLDKLDVLKPAVVSLQQAGIQPLSPDISNAIQHIQEPHFATLQCNAGDAPMYGALLRANDNLGSAVNHMYDALDAYQAAAAAMWSVCSACGAGAVTVCGTCAGLTVAYFAAETNYNNAVGNVNYWSNRVDNYREQVSNWVASHC